MSALVVGVATALALVAGYVAGGAVALTQGRDVWSVANGAVVTLAILYGAWVYCRVDQ